MDEIIFNDPDIVNTDNYIGNEDIPIEDDIPLEEPEVDDSGPSTMVEPTSYDYTLHEQTNEYLGIIIILLVLFLTVYFFNFVRHSIERIL